MPGRRPSPPAETPPGTPTGLDRFVETLENHARRVPPGWAGSALFVSSLGEECAYICLRDLRHPLRFLRQMAGPPPRRFGTSGFNPALVDDQNPVRHYMAFVVAGFWLPALAAVALLYTWEILGFFRYGFSWSPNDVAAGWVGLHHGRSLRRYGP
ncbi:MAG: hypothetical protein ACRC1H_08150, partial [Caldilineaceae bacterium]